MLGLLLKIRYGKNAKAIERFVEFAAAAYFLILAAAAPLAITVAAAAAVMLVFCYAIGRPAWQVFAHPPLSVPAKELAVPLFLSSLLSAPMIAGVIASMIHLTIAVAAVMVIVSAGVFCVFFQLKSCTKKPAQLICRPLVSVRSKPAQYLVVDWQRRRSRWLNRVALPFIGYPLLGTVIVQVLTFHGLRSIPAGIALGLICNLTYLYTDDAPGNFVRSITGVPILWAVLPLSFGIAVAVVVSYLLNPELAQIIALGLAAVCALGIGVTKSVISDHQAPIHTTAKGMQPTVIQDVVAQLVVLSVYVGCYIAVTLV